jgi:TetR/AcrR family transcriptional regulator, transcriptional repressor for nem operon
MGRHKEFDPDAALAAALELFWAGGYEATSMADLESRLGVGRGSIYATFGSKHELYLAALRRYTRTKGPTELAAMSQPGPVLPAVRALVRRYAEEASRSTSPRGCFVVNAATERLPSDREVAGLVEASWTELETALHAGLLRARAQGELGADRDPRALARLLLVVLQGLRVLGKSESGHDRLADAVNEALRLLA